MSLREADLRGTVAALLDSADIPRDVWIPVEERRGRGRRRPMLFNQASWDLYMEMLEMDSPVPDFIDTDKMTSTQLMRLVGALLETLFFAGAIGAQEPTWEWRGYSLGPTDAVAVTLQRAE